MNRRILEAAQNAAAHKQAAISKLSGLPKQHRQRADELWDAKINHQQIAKIRGKERELTRGHYNDLFVTPESLAADMVSICDEPLFKGSSWFEPSAGTGRIVQAMLNAGHVPTCNDISYNNCAHLREVFPALIVFNKNFLEMGAPLQVIPESACYDCTVTPPIKSFAPRQEFIPPLADIFVMNPPFSGGQDIDHVKHAYKYLADGGRIVSVMSEGTFYRSDKKAREFRDWLDSVCGQSEKLPDKTFKTSGTSVSARLVIIDK